ncbi:transcriptional regulator, LacI family [Mariniphaga anaerophila]|uniref:Transcriptional regulator, LacI family n=1 Tax=Mariniphaga anaerophila TaxID=1484053 RepID=A0A1M4U650_9BACT|nr:LacI family DNA-binding transcriptional regulator [Mariniphaga anaerophila]SHE52090.1 transcriptional regulator, LacI family [Mariniphaga anaerophila]
MKHITIKEVAEALNCSISTVSRAFNNKSEIHPDTRERVLQVAAKMGYHPNPIARKLTQQRSYNVGVVVPEFLNPFFPEVIMGIQDVLLEKGYQVLIMQSNENDETEQKNLKTLEDNFVDGIILSLTQESKNINYLQHLINKNYPLVLFNRTNESLTVSKVLFDDYKWALFATEHLIQQGLKELVHIAGKSHLTLSKKRKQGFIDAHRKHKLPVDSSKIIETGFLVEDGIRTVMELIDNDTLPEGFFCVNDATAMGAIKALKKNGYKVPQDIAIMGFTDTPVSSMIEPPLSSVVQPSRQMGEVAAELLLRQIESKSIVIPETVVLSGSLKVRESSVKL